MKGTNRKSIYVTKQTSNDVARWLLLQLNIKITTNDPKLIGFISFLLYYLILWFDEKIKCEIQLSIKTMFQCNKPRSSIKHIWLPNRISILTRATNERNKWRWTKNIPGNFDPKQMFGFYMLYKYSILCSTQLNVCLW